MISKRHYTVNGEHPEIIIEKEKIYLSRLQKHIDFTFDLLTLELGLNQTGQDWLFDYIHNEEKNITFEQYLSARKIKYQQLVD